MKTDHVAARMGTDQISALDERAKAEGVKRSVIVRRAISAYLSDTRIEDIEEIRAGMQKLREDLARVGGNLNQLAFGMNTGQGIDYPRLAEALVELRFVAQALGKKQKVIANALKRI